MQITTLFQIVINLVDLFVKIVLMILALHLQDQTKLFLNILQAKGSTSILRQAQQQVISSGNLTLCFEVYI